MTRILLCRLRTAARRGGERFGALLLLLFFAAGGLLACRPNAPQGERIEAGGWDFYLNNELVGSETYQVRRSGRQLQCTIRSDFPEALASASARLFLSARYRPLEFELEARRPPSGEMELKANFEPRRARVWLKRGDLVREDWVQVSPGARILEEGLVTLGQMALQGLNLRRDDFTFAVLLPQRFVEAKVRVQNLGLERIAVGDGVERPLRHLRLSLAGGASDYWVDDRRRVVRYLSRLPNGELEARRRKDGPNAVTPVEPSSQIPAARSVAGLALDSSTSRMRSWNRLPLK
jgi:hypothetical protein